ncbi:MAG: hypothetical protein RTU63_05020 [Candidatus Thorarchaeota archaeon]
MKKRLDFVTNSSSSCYLVRNTSSTTKNALDLLRECATSEWYFVSWPNYNRGSDYTQGDPDDDLEPKSFPSEKAFLEEVASAWTFPPGESIEILIAWGEGGPIYMPEGGLRPSYNFDIEDLGMC